MTGNVGKNSKLMSMPGGILISATGLLLIPPGEGDPASDCGQKTFFFYPLFCLLSFLCAAFFLGVNFHPLKKTGTGLNSHIYGIGGLLMGDLVYNKKHQY